ncbi:MAG: ferrous iron transport protein B [bacterium]|nr:ferrous iron transport protein B [bacterium]
MAITIALAGNPNSGKTTLFNALTGSNQFVGNWPGVTVEKKEGKLKGHKDVAIMDLPGIYSLSPYTLEEVVARNYLIKERPDAILNIIDGTNLERNLYLTTQLMELGIPVLIAVNMTDIVEKNGDKIDLKKLSEAIGAEAVMISALKGKNITEAAEKAVKLAKNKTVPSIKHKFEPSVEAALQEIENSIGDGIAVEQKRFAAIKLFERDKKIDEIMNRIPNVASIIDAVENELDDDSESIITNGRYTYISSIIKSCYTKKNKGRLSKSDKIDKVVTNRFLALPIFAVVMFIVYYVSVTTVGSWATDWVNDGVFGDGWHLFGIGTSSYEQAVEEWDEKYNDGENSAVVDAYMEAAEEAGIDTEALTALLEGDEAAEPVEQALAAFTAEAAAANVTADAELYDDEGEITDTINGITSEQFAESFTTHLEAAETEPASEEFGVWVPGIPSLFEAALEKLNCADWLSGLILDGIVAGVGAVLGFVPQMLVLFIFLAFLEACGYMARIAFIMDRIFRRFGLSGKSFIPILIGTGCGVPGIMASRTIENERDRRMTIITTTFIPCGAKLPIIALIAGALFDGAAWVAPSAYFIGIAAIICSGIILKKTKMFAGDAAPFVMELPAYHMPTVGNVLRSMWERGWSFIKKAGTVILLSTILIWFLQGFGVENGSFGMVEDMENSLLASVGNIVAFIFAPLGWGNWRAAVAAVTGLIAKENVVGTFGILYGGMDEVAENGYQVWTALQAAYTAPAAFSFLVFNLLCAPCFAAIGAIKREMNNPKWTWFAIGYQCVFAYAVSLCIYQLATFFTTGAFGIGTVVAVLLFAVFMALLFAPAKKRNLSSVKRAA